MTTTAGAHPPKQPIRTQRLVLREARKSDLAPFHELYTNEEVMRYWSHAFKSVTQTRRYLEAMVESPRNGEVAFAIILPPSPTTKLTPTPPAATATDEGKIIGHGGIWRLGKNELVFMIGHTYWSRGYMTEALAALIPIFWEKELKTVFADVDPNNKASLKVLRKCGFKQVGQNVVELYESKEASLRMELTNPSSGDEGEGDVEFADDGSDIF